MNQKEKGTERARKREGEKTKKDALARSCSLARSHVLALARSRSLRFGRSRFVLSFLCKINIDFHIDIHIHININMGIRVSSPLHPSGIPMASRWHPINISMNLSLIHI